MKKHSKRGLAALLAVLLGAMLVVSGCGQEKSLDRLLSPDNMVAVEIWNYYNGPQKIAFDALVDEFNETVGQEKGIVVETVGQGNVNELLQKVLDAANKKVGAGDIPQIFAAYSDTAYEVDRLGLVADLSQYLTEEELGEYVPAYMEEGRFGENEGLRIFPVAKSTEIMMLNKTDWDRFAQATGASLDALKTVEGVTDTARRYYEWTDSLTEAPDDGKAFFGRDAMANYTIIGARQMGLELFEVQEGKAKLNLDENVMRRLWDNYYVPFINGYFVANGRFRSDDAKTGDLIALIGSTSGAAYFPEEVTVSDSTSYPIEAIALPTPVFEGGEPFAVQQGAGMVVSKSDRATEYACVVFLKWFTEAQRNIGFSIESGYLPVKTEANKVELLNEAIAKLPETPVSKNLSISTPVAAQTVNEYSLYTTKAFENGVATRNVLEESLASQAEADRASVQELIAKGTPREQAVAQFNTDEHFKNWYDGFCAELKNAARAE